ncbi:phosphotransferase family protein [Nonomuraea sp. NPDC049400]|uniref:phosphotransferase family protein n=1 Tax=Nonomuraea sp. NPDC049400 TaxID=3364352 RepID=UPI00378D4677
MTFWRHVDGSGPTPGFVDLAVILRQLHDVPKPVDLVLPLFDPLARVEDRLNSAGNVADEDLEFLRQRVKDLYAEYSSINFALPAGHVHGDGHKSNLLRRAADGRVILLDFEAFAWGPRKWDLCTGIGIPFRAARQGHRRCLLRRRQDAPARSRAVGVDGDRGTTPRWRCRHVHCPQGVLYRTPQRLFRATLHEDIAGLSVVDGVDL